MRAFPRHHFKHPQNNPRRPAIAKKYDLVRFTLIRRAQGEITSRETFQSEKHQCLTNAQERILINQINRLTECGIPPTSQMLRKAIDDNNITAENIYNWDEKVLQYMKGFLIGLLKPLKGIMSQEAYRSGRVRQAAQDGNREFITLLACVSAIGRKIPAALIYKGESHDLRDTWVEDLEDSDDFFFEAPSNGWSNDTFGLQWLINVFDPATRATAGLRGKRLLIVDGHSSHINMAFY
ncbi:hypothetical protein G7Y89_g13015 [Cudoniella acicularis]|uniref:DDE-1 domain-containing protein n=1 Tax=Cudoniella acicularis TaxID=354080 RepID=A0A8H4VZ38_9HELO|nr:hypothetical protein G7Y89_g13015 [Cudoniella acicularis]